MKGTRTKPLEKGNQNPTGSVAAFAFGPFELSPGERKLTKKGRAVSIKPKTLDLLLLLVTRAGQLVRKEEIRTALWPDVEVEESNLTNSIAVLRQVLGRKAIRTSPKYGYCFDLPLARRPGPPAEVIALFEEANALFPLRSLAAMTKARDLYWICLAEAPHLPRRGPGWEGAAAGYRNTRIWGPTQRDSPTPHSDVRC